MTYNLNPVYLKAFLLGDYLNFVRYFFKAKYGKKIQLNQHVVVQARYLQKVIDGEIQHLITNIGTGYTKSTLHGEFFFPYIMARYPHAQNILLSYGQTLAQTISQSAKSIILLKEYQELFPVKFRNSQDAKGLWKNDLEGGLLATSTGGVVTGFNAGTVDSDAHGDYVFNGLLMIDDAQKPDDIYSENYRQAVNENFINTAKQRVRSPKTPIIIVMQRLHHDDLCGYLLRGGTEIKWHHLMLPCVINNDSPYPEDYTHGIKVDHNLPNGALWEYKHTVEAIEEMRKYNPFVVAAQYDQSPLNVGAGIFKDEWWSYYRVAPAFEYKFITGDTAQKTAEHNDYSVFQCWGVYKNELYLIDQVREKWEAPALERNFIDFWTKHKGSGTQTTGRLRYAKIEDKSSGTGLIQSASRKHNIVIEAVQRNKDKLTRAMDTVPYVAHGYFHLPETAPWLFDFKKEFRDFSADGSHKHDDQVDALLDAGDELFGVKMMGGAF